MPSTATSLSWACFALLVLAALAETSSKQPHIIFVVADDLGWTDVGVHSSEIKTPNIDRLMETGVNLDQYYVQYQCSPSRAAFLSGRYPINTGLQHGVIMPCENVGLSRQHPLISNALKSAGYRTAMVGKWHLGMHKWSYTPVQRGFQSFFGLLNGKMDYFKHTLPWKGKQYRDLWRNTTPVREDGKYATFLFVNETEKVLKMSSPEKPLFLYLAFTAPHHPHQAPAEYLAKYKGIKDHKRQVHAAMMTALDDAMGDVETLLKRYGYWDNTVLVFTSDNGGSPFDGGLNWPLRGGKFTLFEGGLRVVGFVNSPLLPQGRNRKAKALIHAVDWYPTFVRLATGKAPKKNWLDGVNQWETIMKAAKKGPRKEILYNIDPLMERKGVASGAIRVGKYKLIVGDACRGNKHCGWMTPARRLTGAKRPASVLLYNLKTDPNERRNIAKRNPKIVAKLKKRLAKHAKTMVKPLRKKNTKIDSRCNPKNNGGIWKPWL